MSQNPIVHNTFAKGPDAWAAYDYHASMIAGGRNIFIYPTKATDPATGRNYIWVDHVRWSADTPENPLSILPLLHYRSWMNLDPIDLRNAQVSVYLRGDDLNLNTAHCLFWVHYNGGRWHLDSQHLPITPNAWSKDPVIINLPNNEKKWHHSWPRNQNSGTLEKALANAESYGFSFIGFGAEVTGKFCISDFKIILPAK